MPKIFQKFILDIWPPSLLSKIRGDSFFLYFSYLRHRQYHDIASVVLKHFPYLAKESLNYNDAVDLWHGHVKAKLKKKTDFE